jgi:hypothetical protein
MSELSDFDGVTIRGRVLQVGRSPHGSVILVIKAFGPRVIGRGRFFGHESEFDPSYVNPQPGDLVEFSPRLPNREHQMPKGIGIRRVGKQVN